MTIMLGTLGLLQNLILPGLILQKSIITPPRMRIVLRIMRIVSTSLISNYMLIFFLAVFRIYNRSVMLSIIVFEIIVILWLYRKNLFQPISETITSLWKAQQRELQPLADFFGGRPDCEKDILDKWLWILSGCFALSGVFWGLHLCRLNFGTVFSGWDTLFSWNTYAELWAKGGIPNIRGMYPQLIPANWSLSYLLQGENAVQFFNTLLPPLFFLMIQLMLFDLGFQRKESGFFFAAIISRYMMKKLMGDQIFDGYMDVPAAAMCLMSIYMLLKAEKKSLAEQKTAVAFAVLSAAGAAITKQSGFAALIISPLAVRILLPAAFKAFSRKQKLLLAAAVLLITVPWYLHCLLYNTHGYERELIAEGIMDYNHQYDLQYRVRLAVNTLGKYGICFLLSLIGLPFVPKRYRLLFSLMVWPLTIIWAVFYSYDARNLAPVLPFVSLLCGLAIDGSISSAVKLLSRAGTGKLASAILIITVSAAALILLIRLYPDKKLIEDQRTKQKALFGEQLNHELLYGILGETHSGYDLYTDYPAWFLPGYEECCSSAELTDTFQVRTVLEQEKINWMLLPVIMPHNSDPSKELIQQCIRDGKCEQVGCSDGYYKSYCLYQIHH